MTPSDHTDPTPKQKDLKERQPQAQGSELAEWLAEVDRLRARIRERVGDQPLPDIDELIDAGRDEWLDDLIASLPRRTETTG